MPKGAVTVAVEGGTFGLPVADLIDGEEKASAKADKLAKGNRRLKGRVNNPKFVASALEDVVAEARENLAAREEEEAKTKPHSPVWQGIGIRQDAATQPRRCGINQISEYSRKGLVAEEGLEPPTRGL